MVAQPRKLFQKYFVKLSSYIEGSSTRALAYFGWSEGPFSPGTGILEAPEQLG